MATAAAALSDDGDALARALAPNAWMGERSTWPCRYSASVAQSRHVGERQLRSSGRLFQDCERGLIWSVERPRLSGEVFARRGNFLGIDRRGAPRTLDGLIERRIGQLLTDLFAGDVSALARDFSHEPLAGGGVRLTPKASTLARHLEAIDIVGDADATRITVLTGTGPGLQLTLDGWRAHDDDGAGGCATALGGTALAPTLCDALWRPARYLDAVTGR